MACFTYFLNFLGFFLVVKELSKVIHLAQLYFIVEAKLVRGIFNC